LELRAASFGLSVPAEIEIELKETAKKIQTLETKIQNYKDLLRPMITGPKSPTYDEVVNITGENGYIGHKIFVISYLKSGVNRCYLQPRIVTPRLGGSWVYENCKLVAVDKERELYALSVPDNKAPRIQELLTSQFPFSDMLNLEI